MPTLKSAAVINAPFSNSVQQAIAQYSFADDGGATGQYIAFKLQSDIVVVSAELDIVTTVTSASTANMSVGPASNDDLFIDSIAKASLTANAVIFPVPVVTEGTPNVLAFPVPARVAAGDNICLAIEGNALTAGVVNIILTYRKF